MNPLITALFFIFLSLVSCDHKSKAPESTQYNSDSSDSVSFYDFSFMMEVVDERYGVVENIKYDGFLTQNKDSCFIQHHIFVDESNNEYKVPKQQTIRISVSKMDSVYHIIANTVTPKYLRNKINTESPSNKIP